MDKYYPPLSPFVTGLFCRCPRCGQGPLLSGFLTVRPACSNCQLDFRAEDAGDGPAVFVILIVGTLSVILAAFMEVTMRPDTWVHMLVQVPFITILSGLCLRPLKCIVIGLEFQNQVGGFAPDDDEEDDDEDEVYRL